MTDPVFNQIAGRLYALSSSADSGVPGYWAGYLSGNPAGIGNPASLAQAWEDTGGVFLFLAATPADPVAFSQALIAYLPQASPRGTVRFLWLANPAEPWFYWQTQQLDALPIAAPSASWQVVRDAGFYAGSYAVRVNGGAALTLSTVSGAEAIQLAAAAVRFVAPDGVYPAQSLVGQLPFSGPGVGSLTFGILLPNGTQTPDDMGRLGVMLRYGVASTASLVGAVDPIDMPLFSQVGATAIPMGLAYDPLFPLIGDRSHLSFFPAAGATPPALSCALLTNRGHGTLAQPLNAAAPLSPARLVFGRTPWVAAADEVGTPFDYHLTPDGAFGLTVVAPPELPALPPEAGRLMLGASGAEYAALPATGACQVYFRGGGEAYVPAPPTDGKAETVLLTGLGTTAYATILPGAPGATGLAYYAQPSQAPLFGAAANAAANFLYFHEMQAATLPGYQSSDPAPPSVLPIGVYSWISTDTIAQARFIDEAALAPARRAIIGLPTSGHQRLASFAPSVPPPMAVTPQGLVALLSADQQSWAGMLLANMPRSEHTQLTLTSVGPALQSALQSNQLFFVVSNVDTFMTQSSVAYQLTAANALRLMQSTGVPPDVAARVNQTLATHVPAYPLCVNETEFNAAVRSSAGTSLPQVQNAAGLLRADIEGWNFQLSPRSWRKQDGSPTLMLVKFCNRPLTELAVDPASWGWKQAAEDKNGDLGPTLKALKAILDAARARADTDGVPESDPYLRFYVDIASNPLWSGVLFLNAPVDFTQMPQPLQFLAAGIDTNQFYAHHIGFSVTPYSPGAGTIVLGQTAAFGLIDYVDPQDLVAGVPPLPFGFKTLQLKVVFANAAIVDFAVQVELMVNRLFGSPVQKLEPRRGNNLVLDGSYQRIGGAPSYSFLLIGNNLYLTRNTVLQSIDVLGLRLETAAAAADNSLTARFILRGAMRFALIETFDLFSYGLDPKTRADGFLAFDGLAIGMSFSLAAPARQTFSIAESALSFDTSPTGAVPRAASLANNFPLQLLQLIASPNTAPEGSPPAGQSPSDLGFTSISAPLEQTPMQAPWYGLSFALDFGTLGALTGAIGLKVTLLAAWMQGVAGSETPPAFLGLNIANTKVSSGSLPLQGVLRLGFRSFQFETYMNDQNQLAYLLRMRRFALSALVWSFPPGNADLMLFGAPGQPRSSLGWYAAYANEPPKEQSPRLTRQARPSLTSENARRLRSGRREPPVGSG